MASDGSVFYDDSGNSADILKPTLVVVDGRSYRKFTDESFGRRDDDQLMPSTVAAVDELEEEDEACDELENLKRNANGQFCFELDIPSVFYKYIIGREGKTRAIIEKETGCRLKIPAKGKEGKIVVEAPRIGSLRNATRRIEIVAWSNREREHPTHFASLPLNMQSVMERLNAFKDRVMALKIDGVDETLFQLPCKLHITLGVMRIFSDTEEKNAESMLQECIEKAKQRQLGVGRSTVLCIRGIECMNDDPSQVDVLYGRVHLLDGSERLQRFIDSVVETFVEMAPHMMKHEFQRESVKLHVTIMNSKFASSQRKRFDARRILQELSGFDFGQAEVTSLHLSKRGEYGRDGYYKCVSEFSLL